MKKLQRNESNNEKNTNQQQFTSVLSHCVCMCHVKVLEDKCGPFTVCDITKGNCAPAKNFVKKREASKSSKSKASLSGKLMSLRKKLVHDIWSVLHLPELKWTTDHLQHAPWWCHVQHGDFASLLRKAFIPQLGLAKLLVQRAPPALITVSMWVSIWGWLEVVVWFYGVHAFNCCRLSAHKTRLIPLITFPRSPRALLTSSFSTWASPPEVTLSKKKKWATVKLC